MSVIKVLLSPTDNLTIHQDHADRFAELPVEMKEFIRQYAQDLAKNNPTNGLELWDVQVEAHTEDNLNNIWSSSLARRYNEMHGDGAFDQLVATYPDVNIQELDLYYYRTTRTVVHTLKVWAKDVITAGHAALALMNSSVGGARVIGVNRAKK